MSWKLHEAASPYITLHKSSAEFTHGLVTRVELELSSRLQHKMIWLGVFDDCRMLTRLSLVLSSGDKISVSDRIAHWPLG